MTGFDPAYFGPYFRSIPPGPLGPSGADSPYFNRNYFDPTYFDTDGAVASAAGGGRNRRLTLPPVPEPDEPLNDDDEVLAWTT